MTSFPKLSRLQRQWSVILSLIFTVKFFLHHPHTLTIAPYITLVRVSPKQNAFKGHPLNWHLRESTNIRELEAQFSSWIYWSSEGLAYLDFIEEVFLVIRVKEISNTIIGYLNYKVTLEQNVSSGQIPVDHSLLL